MNHRDSQGRLEIAEPQLKQFQALITQLFQCCRDGMRYQSKRFGLPNAELRCLMLFEGERYLTAKHVARRLNVVKSRVTKIVAGLVHKQMVRRIRDPKDSRVILLGLTPDGQRKLRKIRAFNDGVHHDVLSRMEPNQRRTLMAYLERLRTAMEETREWMV